MCNKTFETRDLVEDSYLLDIASPTRWHQCKQESYEGTQLGQIKYIVNCTEQTTEGIQATYMELLVRRAMKRVPGPISCLRLPGTLQQSQPGRAKIFCSLDAESTMNFCCTRSISDQFSSLSCATPVRALSRDFVLQRVVMSGHTASSTSRA